ncbi:hypothetical protein ACHAQH_010017, partial [Verticillium albo-atrum]
SKMKLQLFTAAIYAALAIATPVAPEVAEDKELAARAASVDNVQVTEEMELALELVLTEFTSIPDEVLLKGDDATNDWLVENGFRDGDEDLEDDKDNGPISARSDVTSLSILERDELEARGPLQVAKCIYAISKAIISTAIPAAKILRIKRYLKLLGGVRKTVLLLVRAKTTKQRLKLGGRALVNIANELFGIKPIKSACSKI